MNSLRNNPPPILGGQGRTAQSIEEGGVWLAWLLCIGLPLGVILGLSGVFG